MKIKQHFIPSGSKEFEFKRKLHTLSTDQKKQLGIHHDHDIDLLTTVAIALIINKIAESPSDFGDHFDSSDFGDHDFKGDGGDFGGGGASGDWDSPSDSSSESCDCDIDSSSSDCGSDSGSCDSGGGD